MEIEKLLSLINDEILKNEETSLLNFKKVLDNLSIINYKKYCLFDENMYKRNLVGRNQKVEIFIMCWKPEQGSKFHTHPGNGCLMKILEGELTEEFKKIGDKNKYIVYKKNECNYIDNQLGTHRVFNNSDKPAVSLHIYSPPNYYTQS